MATKLTAAQARALDGAMAGIDQAAASLGSLAPDDGTDLDPAIVIGDCTVGQVLNTLRLLSAALDHVYHRKPMNAGEHFGASRVTLANPA